MLDEKEGSNIMIKLEPQFCFQKRFELHKEQRDLILAEFLEFLPAPDQSQG